MNTEMQLFLISRKKKPMYEHGIAHKVYENKLNQNFRADEINQKWCTDFTYLFLTDGSKRYNCTIIDLHDRSVIASITDRNITADLAANIVSFTNKICMYGSVTINPAMRVIDFSNRLFDFIFLLMIISFSIFKIVVISIWTDIKHSEKPSEPKFLVIFLNESISL